MNDLSPKLGRYFAALNSVINLSHTLANSNGNKKTYRAALTRLDKELIPALGRLTNQLGEELELLGSFSFPERPLTEYQFLMKERQFEEAENFARD